MLPSPCSWSQNNRNPVCNLILVARMADWNDGKGDDVPDRVGRLLELLNSPDRSWYMAAALTRPRNVFLPNPSQ